MKNIEKSKAKSSIIQKYIHELDDEFHPRSNCKLCTWDLREEAEACFEKTNNFRAVHKFCEKNELNISYPAVRNHIKNHYQKIEQSVMLKEYALTIDKWLQQKTDRRTSLETRIAMLNNEMVILASQTEGQALDERRRTADALKKICDTITSLEDKIAEMDADMKPVFILIEKLRDLISYRIKNSKNDEVKTVLMSLLDDLSESVGNLEIEQ
ncbi:MAG: hypothetical protein ACOC56_06905 [Atribacterota bacterium]